jgi:hypothetical protein
VPADSAHAGADTAGSPPYTIFTSTDFLTKTPTASQITSTNEPMNGAGTTT